MHNIYDMELSLIERRREIELTMRENSLLRQLSEEGPRNAAAGKPALRVRFGRLLIRLGEQLAA